MSAEADYWEAFTYDHDTNTWSLRKGMSPLDLVPIAEAKIVADKAAVARATEDTKS